MLTLSEPAAFYNLSADRENILSDWLSENQWAATSFVTQARGDMSSFYDIIPIDSPFVLDF